MKKFEVGKSYEWYQRENGSVEVIRRSAKFITVRNDFGNSWRMPWQKSQHSTWAFGK